jgi:hypothetical protein
MRDKFEKHDPLAGLLRGQREEIEKYRWIESEKVGEDIGWERAAVEWKRKHFAAWKRGIQESGGEHPLAAIIRFQQEEIERYKWIESEKLGYNIGWERAVQEWQEKHYPEWKSYALRGGLDIRPRTPAESPAPAHVPRVRTSKRPMSKEHRRKLATSLATWWEKKRAGGT